MPRIVITHAVEDKHFGSYKGKELADRLAGVMAPYGTDVAVYVAADGSNRVAIAVNVHDMEGMMAFAQTPEAAANMEADGVILPIVFHIEAGQG